MTYEHLELIVDDGVAFVALHRPPVNAVSQEMYREIEQLFRQLATNTEIFAVVLSGKGKHFCGGNDLVEFRSLDSENSSHRMFEVRRAFWAIYDCPLPVIGAVHGAALGTGLALAASCDFIIAAEGARIGLPEISVGVMGGAKHLRRLVPEPVLRWMFLSGEPASLDLLHRLGAVLDVVPESNLLKEAEGRARRLARHAGVSVRIGKRTLNAIETMDLKHGYEFEQASTGLLANYADSQEARDALVAHREPRFANLPTDLRDATYIRLGG